MIRIDPDDLQAEYVNTPAQLWHFATTVARAKKVVALRSLDIKQKEAMLATDLRAAHELEKGKSPTVEHLKNMVTLDPSLQAMQQELADLECLQGEAQAILMALQAKRDLLIQLGADHRAQYQKDITLREQPIKGKGHKP